MQNNQHKKLQATDALEVTKKRRIYDITNVMEGCSLIKKIGKNKYKWSGRTNIEENSQDQEILNNLKQQERQISSEEQQLNE